MSTAISIEELTTEENLQLMESLWSDLSAKAGTAVSPEWHEQELARRTAALARGDDDFEAWETAKKTIRAETE